MAQAPSFDIYNPTAYQAPEMPQVQQQPTPNALTSLAGTKPEVQPTISGGKSGNFAYIADSVMRGFSTGLAQAQIANAQKLQHQSQSLQASYNLAAKNLSDTVQSMNLSPEQMRELRAGKKPAGMSDDDFKRISDANAAVQGSWGAWTQWQGQHIEPQKGSKGKGKKGQPQQPEQGNPIQNVIRKVGDALRGNDPAAVSQAVYQFWVQNGPPVYSQLDTTLAQSAERAQRQKAESVTTDFNTQLATMKDNLLKEINSPTPSDPAQAKAREDKIKSMTEQIQQVDQAFSPYRKPNAAELELQDYDALLQSGRIPNSPGTNVPMSREEYHAYAQAHGREAGAPAKLTPFQKWTKENPNGTVEEYEKMLSKNRTANQMLGTWSIQEDSHGNPVLLNSKTGQTQQAPEGLHKSGYYAKQIAPLEAAKLNIQEYMDNGVFDGPGDLALQHEFFTATQPATGFRMTKVQQDILQNSRSWVGSAEAQARHAATGQWYTDDQRKQIAAAAAEAIANKEKSLEGTSGNAGKFEVTDPNGKVHTFDTQAQADAFKKLAKIK